MKQTMYIILCVTNCSIFRLKPLYPVNIEGPSIERCRGIVSGKFGIIV